MRSVVSGLLIAGCLMLTGCGNAEPGAPQDPEPPGTGESPPAEAAELTISGTVERGVEAGCLVLEHEGTQYLLLTAGENLEPGTQVEITGTTEPDAMTICQQGLPLRVDEVRPAS